MRLLILGASGGCGQWLTRIAVARGHEVTALVRGTARTSQALAGATIVRGDVLDPACLPSVLRRQDVVLSALGMRRASRNPWSALLSPPDFTARAVRGLIPAMEHAGVTRLVAISAAGVGDSDSQLTWPVRRLLSLGNVGVAYRDLAVMESELAASRLDWLVVRPVALVDGEVTGTASAVTRFGLASTIRRADVAQWMVEAAESVPQRASRFVTLGS
ncbi:MAG: NAD(P)H-binding protein [Gemmatimonadaceae bacterium]|nr:NAD(P)H-binding protein [Gemmatimonadaceae bacterium]